MFGWFKKKKKQPDFKEIVSSLISFQLIPKYQTASKAFGALMTNNVAAGYVFGFHDCLLQRMGLYDQSNPSKARELIEDSYKNIFGSQAGFALFSKSISKQEDPEFKRGRMEGGNEADKFLSTKTPALGLGRILILNIEPENNTTNKNPISKLEVIIKNWPAEQSEAAVRCVKSILEGSDKFEKYFEQLTISQIKTVNEIIEEIENEA
jgi:hypothetical protein